jgi:hypothetical protein
VECTWAEGTFSSSAVSERRAVGKAERKESEQKKGGKERDTNSGAMEKKEIKKRFEVLTSMTIF